MKLENPNSKLIWDRIREIMKKELDSISFTESSGVYSITPLHIRWKNLFLNNLYWGYTGKGQKGMIVLSDEIIKIVNMINPDVMNIEEYVKVLTKSNFSIHLTNWDNNRQELQDKFKNNDNNYVIITQKDRVEEFITTIVAKLFFMKKGYLVGEFEIPVPKYYVGYGIPDIVGIKGDFVNKLKSKGIIPSGGDESDILIWQELKNQPSDLNEPTETIICEVKSSQDWNKAYQQLYDRGNSSGYLKSHCFNKGYACFSADSQNEAERKKISISGSKYEAGSLIFIANKEPVFNEDPICQNPGSCRRAAAVSVNDNCQKELIKLANKKMARIMISNIVAINILKNTDKMRVNDIFREINRIRVEDVV